MISSCSKKNDNTQPSNPFIIISGTAYTTVVIGNQTWTSINYNGPSGINYPNDTNLAIDGKLYTIAQVESIVLPSGWRLPTSDDYDKLLSAVGVTPVNGLYEATGSTCFTLMAKTGWSSAGGTNLSGFNVYAVGTGDSNFYGQGSEARFLTSTMDTVNQFQVNKCFIIKNTPTMSEAVVAEETASTPELCKASIRFVKDN